MKASEDGRESHRPRCRQNKRVASFCRLCASSASPFREQATSKGGRITPVRPDSLSSLKKMSIPGSASGFSSQRRRARAQRSVLDSGLSEGIQMIGYVSLALIMSAMSDDQETAECTNLYCFLARLFQ